MNKRTFLKKIVKEILLEQEQISKIITDRDSWGDYKAENGVWYYRKKGTTDWKKINAAGAANLNNDYPDALEKSKNNTTSATADVNGSEEDLDSPDTDRYDPATDGMYVFNPGQNKGSIFDTATPRDEGEHDPTAMNKALLLRSKNGEVRGGNHNYNVTINNDPELQMIGANLKIGSEYTLEIVNCPNLQTLGNGVEAGQIIVKNCPKLVQFPNGKTDELEIERCAKMVAIGNVTGLTQKYIGVALLDYLPKLKVNYVSHLKIARFQSYEGTVLSNMSETKILMAFGAGGGDIKQLGDGGFEGLSGDDLGSQDMDPRQVMTLRPGGFETETEIDPIIEPEDEPTRRDKRLAKKDKKKAKRLQKKVARKQDKVDKLKQKYGVA